MFKISKITSMILKLLRDLDNVEPRRAYFFADLNIVRVSALGHQALRRFDMDIEITCLPLHDLPRRVNHLIKIVENAKYSNNRINEDTFSRQYWGPLLHALFPAGPLCTVNSEARLNSVNEAYPDLKADFVVELNIDRYDDLYPVLLIELSKEPLEGMTSIHKDEEKLAGMLVCSLMKIIGTLKNANVSQVDLKSVTCFGLLIGAYNFEICTMAADFDENNDIYFIFGTSRTQWRYRILKGKNDQETKVQDAEFLVCKGEKRQRFKVNPSKLPRHGSSSSTDPFDDDLETIENDFFQFMDVQEEKPLHAKVAQELYQLHRTGVADKVGLAVLVRLKNLVMDQIHLIYKLAGKGPFPPSDPDFVFPVMKVSQLDAGRKTANTPTPLLTSSKYRSLQDESTFEVEKLLKSNELQIYLLPEINQSICFPKLLDFKACPKGRSGLFTLEAVVPLNKFVGSKEVVLQAFPELLEALNILHSTGFVHGDVSPGNVGYNAKAGRWQLFDFDQSRPIEEAATKAKRGGTEGFRSVEYETTGLFKTSDDFISLKLVILWWLKKKTGDEYDVTYKFLEPLISAIDSREPFETLQNETSKLWKNNNCNQIVP